MVFVCVGYVALCWCLGGCLGGWLVCVCWRVVYVGLMCGV